MGKKLSPELLQSIPGYKKEINERERNDIRTGTITTGVGIGIALFGQFGVSETPACRNWATGVHQLVWHFLPMVFTTKIRKLMMFLNGSR